MSRTPNVVRFADDHFVLPKEMRDYTLERVFSLSALSADDRQMLGYDDDLLEADDRQEEIDELLDRMVTADREESRSASPPPPVIAAHPRTPLKAPSPAARFFTTPPRDGASTDSAATAEWLHDDLPPAPLLSPPAQSTPGQAPKSTTTQSNAPSAVTEAQPLSAVSEHSSQQEDVVMADDGPTPPTSRGLSPAANDSLRTEKTSEGHAPPTPPATPVVAATPLPSLLATRADAHISRDPRPHSDTSSPSVSPSCAGAATPCPPDELPPLDLSAIGDSCMAQTGSLVSPLVPGLAALAVGSPTFPRSSPSAKTDAAPKGLPASPPTHEGLSTAPSSPTTADSDHRPSSSVSAASMEAVSESLDEDIAMRDSKPSSPGSDQSCAATDRLPVGNAATDSEPGATGNNRRQSSNRPMTTPSPCPLAADDDDAESLDEQVVTPAPGSPVGDSKGSELCPELSLEQRGGCSDEAPSQYTDSDKEIAELLLSLSPVKSSFVSDEGMAFKPTTEVDPPKSASKRTHAPGPKGLKGAELKQLLADSIMLQPALFENWGSRPSRRRPSPGSAPKSPATAAPKSATAPAPKPSRRTATKSQPRPGAEAPPMAEPSTPVFTDQISQPQASDGDALPDNPADQPKNEDSEPQVADNDQHTERQDSTEASGAAKTSKKGKGKRALSNSSRTTRKRKRDEPIKSEMEAAVEGQEEVGPKPKRSRKGTASAPNLLAASTADEGPSSVVDNTAPLPSPKLAMSKHVIANKVTVVDAPLRVTRQARGGRGEAEPLTSAEECTIRVYFPRAECECTPEMLEICAQVLESQGHPRRTYSALELLIRRMWSQATFR